MGEPTYKTDTLEMTATVTRDDGVQMDVEIALTYPEGFGLTAVKALVITAEQNTEDMFRQLIQDGDEETVMAFMKMKAEQEGED